MLRAFVVKFLASVTIGLTVDHALRRDPAAHERRHIHSNAGHHYCKTDRAGLGVAGSAETFRRFDAADYLDTDERIAAYLEASAAVGDPAVITAARGTVARA